MLRTVVLLSALAAGPAALAVAPAAPAATTPAPTPATVPVIDWNSCDGARCARVQVPLDYDDPTGAQTTLNLLKVPAGDPSNRIGTLFVNPGGPGAPAADFARYFAELVRPVVSERFDIVGIDPRGTSTPYSVCRSDDPAPGYPDVAFPMTAKQVAGWIRYDSWERAACRTGANPITGHLSTADTARDLDLIRQAVGDEKLSYYGISYGSYLGQTYAAMFPDNVRAMIIDGVLDPVAWATGRNGSGTTLPFSTRLKSGYGAAEALTSALTKCDQVGRNRCALSGSARQTWDDLVRRLRKGPVKLDGFSMRYSDLVGGTLGFLYSADYYPQLMAELKRLHRQVFGKAVARHGRPTLTAPTDGRGVPGRYGFGASHDPFHAIACADTVNPGDPKVWQTVANNFEKAQPWFGRLWTWVSSTCASWPKSTGADAFRGPFDVTTAPLLVIGNSHDPATPISGARAAQRIFAGSRLLELRGWGHGALGSGPCVANAMRDYLVGLTLPAEGATCLPAHELFPRR